MARRPPTLPLPVDMPNLAQAIEMMATALQQQSATTVSYTHLTLPTNREV